MESHATEIVSEVLLRWIVLVPLLGAAANGLLNRRIPRQVAGLLACAAVGVSFVLSVVVFLRLTGMPADGRLVSDTMATWMGLGNFRVDLAFAMDPLSAVMALVVTGVGFPDPHLQPGLHVPRRRFPAVLHLPEPVHLRHDDPGAG